MKDKKSDVKLGKRALKKVAGGETRGTDLKNDLTPTERYLCGENWGEEGEIDQTALRENSPGGWETC